MLLSRDSTVIAPWVGQHHALHFHQMRLLCSRQIIELKPIVFIHTQSGFPHPAYSIQCVLHQGDRVVDISLDTETQQHLRRSDQYTRIFVHEIHVLNFNGDVFNTPE